MPSNWVDRFAPRAIRPWLKLGRFDWPVGIWLLMLPGWQGIALADAMEHRLPNLGLSAAGAAAALRAGALDAKAAPPASAPRARSRLVTPIPESPCCQAQFWT